MKKILITLLILINTFTFVNADSSDFINSPNRDDLIKIKDKKTRVCEEIFLRVYMRRDFTTKENRVCRNIFARKIEAEMNYKFEMLYWREIY